MKKILLSLCTAALVFSALSGCTQSPQTPRSASPSPTAPSDSSSPAPEPSETGSPMLFKAGTWLATGGEMEEFYFFDADGASGRTAGLEDGIGVGFTYEQEDGKAVFHMGAADVSLPCTVVVDDEEHITLDWEFQFSQSLTYYSPLGSEAFCFYTNEELCQMALRRYEAENGLSDSGLTVGVASSEDGMVVLQVYQNLGDHNSTAAWYQVDRLTAKGTDMNTGESVELANSPVELRIGFAPEDAQPDGTLTYLAVVPSEYQTKVMLTAQITLKEFKIVSLEPVEDGGKSSRFRVSAELYSLESLTPDTPLIVGLELPETLLIAFIGTQYDLTLFVSWRAVFPPSTMLFVPAF